MTQPNPQSDPDFDPEELDEAVNDAGEGIHAPEVNPVTEELTEWDNPVDSSGHPVVRIEPEDEDEVLEHLVEDGVDVADSEQRIAAADRDED